MPSASRPVRLNLRLRVNGGSEGGHRRSGEPLGAGARAPPRARPGDRLPRRNRHRATHGGPRAHRLHRGGHPQPAALPAAALRPRRTRSSTAGSSGIRSRADRRGSSTTSTSSARSSSSPPASGPRPSSGSIVRGSAAIYGCEGAAPSSSPRTWRGRCRCAPASSVTSPSSRRTSRTSPAATRRSSAACCASSPRSGRSSTRPLVRYLTLPVVPTQLGFDPRLQFLHADDAPRCARGGDPSPGPRPGQRRPDGLDLAEPRAAARPAPRSSDSRIRSSVRRSSGSASAWAPARSTGDGVRLLRYGRGVDNRRLREELGYEPRFDAEGAIRDFAAKSAGRRVGPALHPADLAGRLSEALR